jgi:hypothetical protein
MPNPGSYTFFSNLTVNWFYDSGKQQLTVSATLNGKSIGSTVLSPGQLSGTLSGSESGQAATINLVADFSALALAMEAQETNPTRSQTHTGNF